MLLITILAYLIGIFGVIGTLVPFIKQDDYWIRGFDYPRVQIAVLLLTSAVLWVVSTATWGTYQVVVLATITLAFVYQVARIIPYTAWYPVQSYSAQKPVTEERALSLIVCNVLQTNDQYHRVVNLILDYQPDLVLTLESDQTWGDALHAGLDQDYPHHVDVPQDNLYGMHLFSRLPLENAEVKFRIKENIPSIDVTVRRFGAAIDLYCLHPLPPSPTEAYASTGRDAELAKVGIEIKRKSNMAIVAGDMNDVAWSHSSRLFQRISKLCDPRRGRGLFATFHADHWWARWPLDHVFHHPDLAVVNLERLPHVGSDHFPIYVKFNYEPVTDSPTAPRESKADLENAKKVKKLGEKAEKDTILPAD